MPKLLVTYGNHIECMLMLCVFMEVGLGFVSIDFFLG